MNFNLLPANAFYDMVAGKPLALQKDNDGSFIFRYNIHPQKGDKKEDGEEEQIGWQCREIRIWEQPTKEALKKAIIRSIIDETKEFAIINAYNKHVLGIRKNQKAVDEYRDFLLFTEYIEELLKKEIK